MATRVRANALDRRGVVWGAVAVAVVVAITFFGSDRLVWFDAALIGYLFGIVFMVFGVAYRYYGGILFGNRPFDPAALTAGAAIATVVVLAGAVWPAMRASRLDASEVLRSE